MVNSFQPFMPKLRNIKFSAKTLVDEGSLGEPEAWLWCFTRGSQDGHNGTQALSCFLSPGRLGYSTFAYPVRYSYKRDARTSLFRPYQSSITLKKLAVFTKKREAADQVMLKAGVWVSSNQDIFPEDCASGSSHPWAGRRIKLRCPFTSV